MRLVEHFIAEYGAKTLFKSVPKDLCEKLKYHRKGETGQTLLEFMAEDRQTKGLCAQQLLDLLKMSSNAACKQHIKERGGKGVPTVSISEHLRRTWLHVCQHAPVGTVVLHWYYTGTRPGQEAWQDPWPLFDGPDALAEVALPTLPLPTPLKPRLKPSPRLLRAIVATSRSTTGTELRKPGPKKGRSWLSWGPE